jgi:hypothetical protein
MGLDELNYLQVVAVWVLECGEPAGGAVRGSRDPIHPSSIQLRLEQGEVVDVEVDDLSAWFGVSVADVISLFDDEHQVPEHDWAVSGVVGREHPEVPIA